MVKERKRVIVEFKIKPLIFEIKKNPLPIKRIFPKKKP